MNTVFADLGGTDGDDVDACFHLGDVAVFDGVGASDSGHQLAPFSIDHANDGMDWFVHLDMVSRPVLHNTARRSGFGGRCDLEDFLGWGSFPISVHRCS